ncbi:glutathione S-transferase family protein [Parasphingopyxis algicola]|uniref:glutathione S-transferase family protein n=1 Tax=Parasphingopyxis algicola TaxID=2026624 RepID=UPI0015A20948|nr:glutathione S-transferase family protein [Parasphingopyxis algicola]QLC23687.1 glutathione S-transferase family protein [Parasphingopyxis algicola]
MSNLTITAFKWVPDFAQGYVRDLRPRWACEELSLAYEERLIDVDPRPESHFAEQPWGQVPVLDDNGIKLFESGAILLHLAEKDERLMPRDAQGRASTLSWLFAAFNSIEPMVFELNEIDIFSKDEEWAKLRRTGLLDFFGQRLDRLVDALGDKPYLTGTFSVADIAMATTLRDTGDTDLIPGRPALAAYVERCLARPGFRKAHADQLAAFARNAPEPVS